jgi:hypothetical protein
MLGFCLHVNARNVGTARRREGERLRQSKQETDKKKERRQEIMMESASMQARPRTSER